MSPSERTAAIVAAAIVASLALNACGDGTNGVTFPVEVLGTEPAVNMTGDWTLTLNPVDPPLVFDCTGDLAGESFSFCETFAVTLTQDGAFFSSGASDPFCESIFLMTGSATVQEISGVISRERTLTSIPSVVEVQELEFRAGVIGDAATFALSRLTIKNGQGECRLGGSYSGSRSNSR